MRCLEVSELMSLRLDSDLPSQDEQALQQHLLTCEGCRAEWQTMQRACALFADVELAPPEADLRPRVMTRIRRHDLRLAILRNGVVLLLGTVILISLSLTFWGAASSPVEAFLNTPSLVSAVASIVVGLLGLLSTLLRAAALVVRTLLSSPGSAALLGYLALAGALTLWWVRLASGRARLAPRRRRP